MIISKTPIRISFFGGGTDYPDYYKNHKGAVLSTTIDKYIYTSVNKIGGLLDDKYRIAYRRLELCQKIDEIEHPSVRETLRYMNISDGLDINIVSDLPARTGLGSSSGFTVGFINALYAYQGKVKSKLEYAKEAIYVEKMLLNEPVGVQDQLAAAFGGFNYMTFYKETMDVQPLAIASSRKEELERNLLLYYTGISRFSSEVLPEQALKTKNNSINSELSEMYDLVQLGMDILLDTNKPLDTFGTLLHESWSLKRKFSSAISNSYLDDIYTKSLESGSIGGKLLGAGGGGFFLFYVPVERQKTFKSDFNFLTEIPFKFENEGTKILHIS